MTVNTLTWIKEESCKVYIRRSAVDKILPSFVEDRYKLRYNIIWYPFVRRGEEILERGAHGKPKYIDIGCICLGGL
jgi:hypothetical protein